MTEIKGSTRCGGTAKDSDAHQHLLGPVTCCSDPQGSLEGAVGHLSGEITSPPQHLPSMYPAHCQLLDEVPQQDTTHQALQDGDGVLLSEEMHMTYPTHRSPHRA